MKDQEVNRKFRELELKADFLEESKAECEQQIEDLRNERKDLNEQCLNLTAKNADLVAVNKQYPNGKYLNGLCLNGLCLNGLCLNGLCLNGQ